MRRDRGFSLIEVMVALTMGALVVLLAGRLFAAVGDAGQELRAARTALDREANARRWLAATFLSLDVGPEAGPFQGNRDQVAFVSWQLTSGGWFAGHRVRLAVDRGRLIAAVAPRDSVTLADSVRGLGVDYLLEHGAEAHWVREWVSAVSAPVAVRLRIARAGGVDTLLFLIKERG